MADYADRLRALTAEPSTDAGADPARRARVGRTREEMMTQGTALAGTLRREEAACTSLAATAAKRGIRRIVVVGCGDSWIAAIGARLAMEQASGLPVEPAQAFDWAHFASATADRDTLLIGISSGGSTPAVLAALAAAADRQAFAIGMSNTPGAPVLTTFEGGLVVHASRKGWPTQSSTAAMALLAAFAVKLGESLGRSHAGLTKVRDGLATVSTTMDGVATALDGPARVSARAIATTSLILFAGAGPHFATAAFGAAKIRELAPIHAIALPLEEYHHYRSQKRGDPLFLVAPDAASRERAFDTALVSEHVGGRTIALLPGPDADIEARVSGSWHLPPVSDALAPLVYSIPLHLFAYHFAEARFELGLGYPGASAGT
jgi:glucosamine--fructose-6-phosphate aminotransferase (isomerizing)